MPTIDLPADELAAVTAAIRRLIEDDKYPHAPRLDPLRAALARLEAARQPSVGVGPRLPRKAPPAKANQNIKGDASPKVLTPKAPPPAKADKRAR